jgi:hypothetical protein
MPRRHVGKVRSVVVLVLAFAGAMTAGPPPTARADVQVQFQPGPGAEFAARAGVDLETLRGQMQTELQNLFQTSRLPDYLRAFGDAQSFTTRGMGVDYASNFKAVMVGIGANLSLNVEKGYLPEGTGAEPPAGGVVGIAPICLYANYFKRSATIDDFTADLSNFGVHAQLKLFGPEGSGLMDALVQWGGLDITTGFERANLGMTLKQGFRRNIPVGMVGAQGGGSPLIDLNTTGSFRMNARTLSIPLELTTNFRLLYLLSVYGGLGFDWQLGGGSDMSVALNGNMTGVTPAAGGQPSMRVDVGTAAITATESVEPSAGRLRWLLGAQVNVLIVRLFVQLNLATQDPVLASVAMGLRVAF